MRLELGPAAVIRAAAWPIETLDAFGDAELGAAASGSRSGAFDAAYEATLHRERAALWERTAGDPRFMKALLFASPALFERVSRQEAPSDRRTKRIRHLETSLYRYLARAATRTTPGGPWAGVTLARFGDREQVATARARIDVAPDLAPFAAALRALGDRAPYRDAVRWKATPTLRRHSDGSWRFLARSADGGVDERKIEADRTLDPFLERLLDARTGTLGELATRTGVPRQLIDKLVEGGVLVGGLAFPTRFASVWEALEASGDALIDSDRRAWRGTAAALSDLTRDLTERFETLSADDMKAHVARARALVLDLFLALGVEVEVRDAALRCDLGLPLTVTLGPLVRASLEQALTAYQREWIDGQSPLSAARRDHRRALAEALGRTPVPLGEALPSMSSRDAARIEAWAATFHASGAEVRLGAEGPYDAAHSAPWGCLFARLGQGGVTTVLGMDDSPLRSFSRHHRLLGTDNEIGRWMGELISRLKDDHGIKVGDLAAPFEQNPNVLSRARVALAVEPWSPGLPDLRGAMLRSEAGAIVLDVPDAGRLTVVSFSSARALEHDPLCAAIALTGFDEPVEPAFRAATRVAPGEGDTPRYAPRLSLSTGATIRPRRTCLTGPSLDELTCLPRPSRYGRWRELACRLGWPRRVALSIDGGPPLVLDSSSPLALEAAFEGARPARLVLVEEANDTGGLLGETGHHIADVALPFSRTPHAFSHLVESG